MGRTALNAAVPNPFYGLITDPLRRRSSTGRPCSGSVCCGRCRTSTAPTSATSEPPRGDSSYHALQVKWDKRFSHGFSMLAHYTWSKMIDNSSHASGNVSWLGGSTSIQNIWDLDARALALGA